MSNQAENRDRDPVAAEQIALWQQLFEHHPAITCLIDPQSATIVAVNRAACEFFNLSKDQFQRLNQVWFEDVAPEILRRGLHAASEGSRTRFTGSRRCADGEMRTVEALVSPVRFGRKQLLYAVAFDVTERIAQERIIAEKTVALESQNRALAEKNVAIRQIAEQVEASREETLRALAAAVERDVLPITARLRGLAADRQSRQLLDVLEKSLGEIARSCGRIPPCLSAREMEICNLIRGGMRSKEIAQVLGISYRSVENHRHAVRRKLGFSRKTNLVSFLNSPSE